VSPLDFPLLADENIHPEVVRSLRERGVQITTVSSHGLVGRPDVDVLARATAGGAAVLTHDSDFGRLATAAGARFVGIIYLRPGHIDPATVVGGLTALEAQGLDVEPPFVLVVDRRGESVRVRLRSASRSEPVGE
jgi:predicted nuclease of predicted toxin-antitoxin system